MNVTETQNHLPYWESVALNTKWGRYIDTIEKTAIEKAIGLVKNKNCVLEIGCEGGKWLDIASKAGFQTLVGTDVNSDYQKACNKKNKNIHFHCVKPDDTTLPCENNSVDLILVIEVVPVNHSEWFYKEASRILTDDGIIVGVLTNKNSWRGFFFNLSRPRVEIRQKEMSYRYSFSYWKRLITGLNYSFMYERGYCLGPFQRNSNSIFIPIYVFIERLFLLHKLLFLSPWVIFILKKKEI
jgi:SAM-dependent methyltransferase